MPTYSISAPDGNVYKIDGPAGASQEQVQNEVLKQHPSAGTPKGPAAPKSSLDSLMDMVKGLYTGPAEGAAALASGAVAKPVSDLAGLGAIPLHAAGLIQTDPSQVKANVQEGMTYSPQTDAGKAVVGAASAPGQLLGQAATGYGNMMASGASALGLPQGGVDAVRNGYTEAANQLPNILGTKLPEAGAGRIASKAAEAVETAPRQAAIDAAKKAGYPLPPSLAGLDAPIGHAAAGIAGKNDVNSIFAIAGQKVTNNIAKREAGLPASASLNETNLTAAETKAGGAYDAARGADQNIVPKLGDDGSPVLNSSGKPVYTKAGPVKFDDTFRADIGAINKDGQVSKIIKEDPQIAALREQYQGQVPTSTADVVESIKRLRSDAKINSQAQGDVAAKKLGSAQQSVADAYAEQLERYLDKTKQTSVYNNLVAAREQIAKIKNIRDALDGTDVDAAALASQRAKGTKLSGGLAQIADAADNFPNVVKNTSRVQPPAPISALGYTMAAGVGGSALGAHGATVGAGTALAALLAREGIRKGLLTNAYQSTLKGASPTAGALSQLAAQPASPLSSLLIQPDAQQQAQ